MCRLLALINSDKMESRTILDFFRNLAESGKVPPSSTQGHKDGWGIVAYKKGNVVYFVKSKDNAFDDKKYLKSVDKIEKINPSVIVGHLRKSSCGLNKKENNHPFIKGNYVFCHNGTVFNSDKIPLNDKFRKFVKGETDSEKLFLYILQILKESKKSTPEKTKNTILKAIVHIRNNIDYTAMNFIFSDGEFLWALRDFNENNANVKKENLGDYYSLYVGLNKKRKSIVVSSEVLILESTEWKEIKNKELIQINFLTGEISNQNSKSRKLKQ